MVAMFSTVPDLGVAGHLPRPQLPAKARSPQQIQGRLVLLDLGRGHQRQQDDAGLAPVDDVMVLVAQTDMPVPLWERSGVGIGGTDAEVGRAPVGPARFIAVGTTGLPDPVVALRGALGQLAA